MHRSARRGFEGERGFVRLRIRVLVGAVVGSSENRGTRVSQMRRCVLVGGGGGGGGGGEGGGCVALSDCGCVGYRFLDIIARY